MSSSDGNHSECDEINKIQNLKNEALKNKEYSELNQNEVTDNAMIQNKLAYHNFFSRKINTGLQQDQKRKSNI